MKRKSLNFHVKESKKIIITLIIKFHNVLFNKHDDIVVNKGFRYINGTMKSYEHVKKGLSYAYHKRIVCDDGINTKPLNI